MMTDKIKELLAVLDMPVNKQRKRIAELTKIHYEGTLADLAFRLRDEVTSSSDLWPEIWNEALRLVAAKYRKTQKDEWFVDKAQPIHWIIAALIAKELGKDADGKED